MNDLTREEVENFLTRYIWSVSHQIIAKTDVKYGADHTHIVLFIREFEEVVMGYVIDTELNLDITPEGCGSYRVAGLPIYLNEEESTSLYLYEDDSKFIGKLSLKEYGEFYDNLIRMVRL